MSSTMHGQTIIKFDFSVLVWFMTVCRPIGGLLMPSLSEVQYVLMGLWYQFTWCHVSGDGQRHDSLNCDVILAPCPLLQTAVPNFIGIRLLLRRLKTYGINRLLIYMFECSLCRECIEPFDITLCTVLNKYLGKHLKQSACFSGVKKLIFLVKSWRIVETSNYSKCQNHIKGLKILQST